MFVRNEEVVIGVRTLHGFLKRVRYACFDEVPVVRKELRRYDVVDEDLCVDLRGGHHGGHGHHGRRDRFGG